MIFFLNMPFASLTEPSLPVGVFKSQLKQHQMPVHVFNFNFNFARLVGLSSYSTISLLKGINCQISEWVFVPEVWGDNVGMAEDEFLSLYHDDLVKIPHVKNPVAWLKKIRREIVPLFLDNCIKDILDIAMPTVAAFSCRYFQTMAALALGRRMKERFPHIKTIYGGASFHAEMGEELIKKIEWIDVVSTGEADDVIVPMLKDLQQDEIPTGPA